MDSIQKDKLVEAGTLIREFLKPCIEEDAVDKTRKEGKSYTTGYCELISFFTARLLGGQWDVEVGIIDQVKIPAKDVWPVDTLPESDELDEGEEYEFVDKYGVGYADYPQYEDEWGNQYYDYQVQAECHTWLINYADDTVLDLSADQFGWEEVVVMDEAEKKERGYAAIMEKEDGEYEALFEGYFLDVVEGWEQKSGYDDLKEKVSDLLEVSAAPVFS